MSGQDEKGKRVDEVIVQPASGNISVEKGKKDKLAEDIDNFFENILNTEERAVVEVQIERRSMTTKQWRQMKSDLFDLKSEVWDEFLQRILETRGSGEYRFTIIYKDDKRVVYKILDDPRYPYIPGFDEEVEEEEEPEPEKPVERPLFSTYNPMLWRNVEEKAKDDPAMAALVAMVKQQQQMLETLLNKATAEKPKPELSGIPQPQPQSQPQIPQPVQPDMAQMMSSMAQMMKTIIETMKPAPAPATPLPQSSESDIDKMAKFAQIMSTLQGASSQQSMFTPDKILDWTLRLMSVGKDLSMGKVPEIEIPKEEETFKGVGLEILKDFGKRISGGVGDGIKEVIKKAGEKAANNPETIRKALADTQKITGVQPQQALPQPQPQPQPQSQPQQPQNKLNAVFEAAYLMLKRGGTDEQVAQMLLENIPKSLLIRYSAIDWSFAEPFILGYNAKLKQYRDRLQRIFAIMKEFVKAAVIKQRQTKAKMTAKKMKATEEEPKPKKKTTKRKKRKKAPLTPSKEQITPEYPNEEETTEKVEEIKTEKPEKKEIEIEKPEVKETENKETK